MKAWNLCLSPGFGRHFSAVSPRHLPLTNTSVPCDDVGHPGVKSRGIHANYPAVISNRHGGHASRGRFNRVWSTGRGREWHSIGVRYRCIGIETICQAFGRPSPLCREPRIPTSHAVSVTGGLSNGISLVDRVLSRDERKREREREVDWKELRGIVG